MVRLSILVGFVLTAGVAVAAPAPGPVAGVVKHAAYVFCRSAAGVDLGAVGSDSSADCVGIVRTRDGAKPLDNLSLHCLEASMARKSGYGFKGTCLEADADGDKLYLYYEGPESGPISVLGGTGKYAHVRGKGEWSVADAPGNTASQFAFTLTYDLDLTVE